MIEIKDLSYTIGKKEILKNISFTVNKGKHDLHCRPERLWEIHFARPHFPPLSFPKFHLLQGPCGRNHSAKGIRKRSGCHGTAGIWDGRRSEGRGCGSYGAVSV